MNDLPHAIAEFQQALKIRPKMIEPLFNIGVAYMTQGNFLKADEYYSMTIQANPSLSAAFNNRGETRRQTGRRNEAIADFLSADRLTPKNAMIRRNLIRTYIENGKKENAIQVFNETLALGIALDEPFKQQFLKITGQK